MDELIPSILCFGTMMVSSFRHCVNNVFTLLGCYTALIGSYRGFGTTYRFQLEGLSSPRRLTVYKH